MIKAIYPPLTSFNIQQENGKEQIFDVVRKQWVRLTPEEWVRQNFIHFLLNNAYPASLIAVEKEIVLNDLKKRCDIIVYRNGEPWMIIECKETNVPLTEKVVHQVLNYNQALLVKYLLITNGTETFGLNTQTKEALTTLPIY
ncbi:MAG: type I restriction enzyme HsdR N-terminal domain-containing protein [Sphingobacteriia bacterium]|nr:type I restriction enzyme HsdR N-terminal domain-containing protein [Sphingobacteriia bacterium]